MNNAQKNIQKIYENFFIIIIFLFPEIIFADVHSKILSDAPILDKSVIVLQGTSTVVDAKFARKLTDYLSSCGVSIVFLRQMTDQSIKKLHAGAILEMQQTGRQETRETNGRENAIYTSKIMYSFNLIELDIKRITWSAQAEFSFLPARMLPSGYFTQTEGWATELFEAIKKDNLVGGCKDQ